jgi:hypothetical protein
VYAAGLPSGELRITASKEINPETSKIEFPVADKRNVANDLEKQILPGEIKPVSQDLNFSNKNNKGYKGEILKYIQANNNSIDSTSTEIRTLSGVHDSYLQISGGIIKADDYNFNTGLYNMCIRISKYIQATKLPSAFKTGLRDYYSAFIIMEGNEKDAEQEMNWLNWIPSGGTVIYYLRERATVPPDGLVSHNSDLPGLIAEVHPGFIKFSEDAKTRALEFITKMNPYVHPAEKGKSSPPVAEEGKPVLIPLLKYISE